MIIFIHGNDNFRVNERLGILRQGFIKKYDNQAFNTSTFEAEELTITQLRASLLTQGLFNDKKFVVIKNIFNLLDNVKTVFLETMPKIDEHTVLIVLANELPKEKNNLKNRLLKVDLVEEYQELTDSQLRNWVIQKIKKNKATIEPNALAYLLNTIGKDLWSMHHVIQQVTNYKKSINLNTIEQFVPSLLDDNIFHFTDALSNKNTKQALKLLHDQFSAGVNHFYLLSMLARQLIILIQVKETAGKNTGLHPYVVKKTLQHAQRYDLDQLKDLHSDLVELDVTLKSTNQDPELLFDRFIVRCTTV